jgi:hypothetical protein
MAMDWPAHRNDAGAMARKSKLMAANNKKALLAA